MALDGTNAGSTRTLTNREAALLFGQGWECSETGAQVWQRLAVSATSPAELGGEEQTVTKATRLLRRRRLEIQFGLEQLQNRFAHLRAIPLARFAARKAYEELQAQIAVHEQMLKELPQRPVVQRLEPEADSGLPSGALKIGATLWFVNKKTAQVFSCEISGAAIEKLDGPVLVYEARGAEQEGKPVRRTVAHFMDGLKTLGAPDVAFMDPLTARDYLKMITPPPEAKVAPIVPAQKIDTVPPPKPAPAVAKIVQPAAAPAGEVVPDDPALRSIALEPFDESMLE